MVLITPSSNAVELLLALPFIQSLDAHYPNIQDWYVNEVVPGRDWGQVFFAKEGSKLVGVGMCRQGTSPKLRCIRVHPDYVGTGLGIKLIERCFDAMQNDHPHCSVAEPLFHQYSRVFVNRYGFKLSHVGKGDYIPGRLEYYFN